MKSFILILILMAQAAAAQTVAEDKPEFEVQRREFERHLYTKIDGALEAILEKGTYILDIAVTLKKLPPEVVESGTQDNEQFPLNTNVKYDGASGLIPLGKIGVWNRGQAEIKKRPVVHQVRNFTDVIQSVNAELYLDPDKVSAIQKKSVSQVVQSILKSSSPVTAGMHISDLKIYHTPKLEENLRADLMSEMKKQFDAEKPKAAEKKDQPGFLSEFKIPLSIMFTTLVLFALGLIMNRRQALSDERRLKLDEDISRRQEEQLRSSEVTKMEAAVVEKGSNKDVLELGDGVAKQAVGGFVKFSEIAGSEPHRAGYMLKQWIYSSDVFAQGALAILPRVVSLAQLSAVLKLLNDDDRKEWNRLMNKPLGSATFAELDAFVARSIASSMVEPTQEIDQATRQLLATLTPQEAADCIYIDKTIGVLLVQTLPSLQVSRIFNLIDEQVIRDIAFSSTTISKAQVSFLALKFQGVINQVRDAAKSQTSAFVERVPELIREVGYAKEAALFDSVAATRNAKLLHQIANEYLPAELISSLPTDVLKSVFEKLPLGERAELVYSQPEETRRVLMMTVGEGRLKDVLDIEIEEIQANEIRMRTINRSSVRIWQAFVDRVRLKINESPELSQEIEPLIEMWVKQRIESAGSGGLRAAS